METEIITDWCTRIKAKSATELQIAIFHHAGGTKFSYINWGECIADSTELILFDIPGRFQSESEKKTEEIILKMAQQLDILTKKRLILFGHSMGALIALAILFHLNNSPSHIVVSSSAPPGISTSLNHTFNQSDEELLKELKKLGGTPSQVLENSSFKKWIIELFRKDLKLMDELVLPKVQFSIPFIALGGTSDPIISHEELMQWQEWTCGHFHISLYEGGHFYCFENKSKIIQFIESLR